jgi:hypothetical protein
MSENTQKIFVCPNCKSECVATERRINGNSHCARCKWSGPTKDLIEASNEEIKSEYTYHGKEYCTAVIDESKDEIKNLRKIIAKELSENDDLGLEYTYVTILKDELAQLKSELSKKDSDIKEILAIIHEQTEHGTIHHCGYLYEKLEKFEVKND